MKAFDVLQRLIYATNERQKVLSSNIANSDTPQFKSKDIDFKHIVEEETMGLKTTSTKHIASNAVGNAIDEPQPVERQPWLDENDVEIDEEVAKMTENSILHEAATQFMSIRIRQFKEAVRGR